MDNKAKKTNWLKLAILAALALPVFISAALLWYGCQDRIIEAKVAVVLGNEVYRSGSPAPRLAARLDKSIELYKNGHCQTIIVSGGRGKSQVDEATAMSAYLQSKGVPGWAIVVDSEGHNTWRTALFTAEYLKKNNLDSVIVVSQHFHVHRSAMALKAAGCLNVGTAAPDYWERRDIYSVAREVPANLYYWLKYGGGAQAARSADAGVSSPAFGSGWKAVSWPKL